MSTIRIAHITTVDLALRHLLLNQLIAIRNAGYDVTSISSPGADVSILREHGFRHIAVPMTRSMTPCRDAISLGRLYSVFKKERFDIVHTHNPKPGLLGQIAAKAANTPTVVNTLHGFYFHEFMPTWKRQLFISLEKIAARHSDLILSQNEEDVKTAITEGICRPEKIRHLGNGIDLDAFNRKSVDTKSVAACRRELGLPQQSKVVGFVGRLVKEKGVLELVRAARHFRESDVRFLFVGSIDRSKKDAVSATVAREYGVEEVCIFAGMRYDMPVMYALMDVCVLPSYREGFPRSLMEATAMGVPVIASDVRGCREAVVEGRNGVLVPVGDSDRLAREIERLLFDSEWRQTLSKNARPLAEERFGEQRVFQRVLDAYDQLLRNRLPPNVQRS